MDPDQNSTLGCVGANKKMYVSCSVDRVRKYIEDRWGVIKTADTVTLSLRVTDTGSLKIEWVAGKV